MILEALEYENQDDVNFVLRSYSYQQHNVEDI